MCLCPLLYRFPYNRSVFYYINKDNQFYEFICRIIRFKISEDLYKFIVTHLDREKFFISKIKDLYHMHLGIRTLFKEVNYAVILSALFSKKQN